MLSYSLQFAALTALVTHTICWNGKDIVQQWKRGRKESWVWGTGTGDVASVVPPTMNPALLEAYKNRRKQVRQCSSGRSRRKSRCSLDERAWIDLMGGEDVHMRLMRRYKEAPASWYLITFAVMLGVGIFVVE